MGRKEDLIIRIRLARFYQFKRKQGLNDKESMEKALKSTKGYFQKKVTELQLIWKEEHNLYLETCKGL